LRPEEHWRSAAEPIDLTNIGWKTVSQPKNIDWTLVNDKPEDSKNVIDYVKGTEEPRGKY
jgi:hypothetical protein